METCGQSCRVPNRWLRTEHSSLAAAFVVRVLADAFCPCLLPRHMLVLVQNAEEKCTRGELRCVQVCSLCSLTTRPRLPGGRDLKGARAAAAVLLVSPGGRGAWPARGAAVQPSRWGEASVPPLENSGLQKAAFGLPAMPHGGPTSRM